MEKMKRIAAFLMVLVILGLVVWVFISVHSGSGIILWNQSDHKAAYSKRKRTGRSGCVVR